MKRSWHIWALFALCLAVALAGTGWISAAALRADRAERAARRRAELEESIRLALWRMDSMLSPLIARESARPYFAYTAFYPVERAYTSMFAKIETGEVLTPSPLLTHESPYIRLHFQFAPDGSLASPQAPEGNMRDLAEMGYVTHERIIAAGELLDRLKQSVRREDLLRALGRASEPAGSSFITPGAAGHVIACILEAAVAQADAGRDVQRNIDEWRARQQSVENIRQPAGAPQPAPPGVSEGALQAVWVGDALLLARCIRVSGGEYVQGCWLDWPRVRDDLARDIADLLPGAKLVPYAGTEPALRLAALPVRLVPGAAPAADGGGMAPLTLTLLAAWGGVLVAAAAVAVLLRGAVTLSERRGAFVSAVTHEMRTPLTTFQMYTEMLAEGMVADDAKRARYLNTLRAEADRLGHLVENVLAYARLERGAARDRVQTMTTGELLGGMRDRLVQRAEQAGMTLIFEVSEARDTLVVRTDPAAVEQILFNLVDNACKYASAAADRTIRVQVEPAVGGATLAVADHGPGISRERRRDLFRPFSKSAHDAADSAPGVGLGLALSRRLARSIGGDLRLDADWSSGARFVLTLPGASAGDHLAGGG